MTPRKHADLIKAWADGAEIQRSVGVPNLEECSWVDEPHPDWAVNGVYRIKPVQKADYMLLGWIHFLVPRDNLKVEVLCDGKTGEVKKVEIVK